MEDRVISNAGSFLCGFKKTPHVLSLYCEAVLAAQALNLEEAGFILEGGL